MKDIIKLMDLKQIQKLSEKLLKEKKKHEITIKKCNKKNSPLSFAQERILFLTQLLPNAPAYHVPLAIHIKSEFVFDINLLETSLNKIIERHEILRTVFNYYNMSQTVLPEQKINLQYISILNQAIDLNKIKQLIIKDNNKPFDLEKGPLLRFLVLHLSEKEYIFVIIIHHIISDGWSNNMLFKELAITYGNLLSGNTDQNLPEFQYTDYVEWEKKFFRNSSNLDNLFNYWKKHLAGELTYLQLPTDYKCNKVNFSGKAEIIELSKELVHDLKNLCTKEKITLFELFLSTLFILMYAYTNQIDIIIGSAVVNRESESLQRMLGLFTNTVLYRIKIDEFSSIDKLIQKVSQLNREILGYQALPFDMLIKELNPERTFGQVPLIPVFFSYQNFPKMFEYENMKVSPFKLDYEVSRFDLDLMIEETENSIYLTLSYRNDLFNSITIKNMLFNYVDLLKIINNDKLHIVSNIQFPSNSNCIIYTANNEKVPYPSSNFCELFEEQVKNTPTRSAIESEVENLTYHELNAKSNQLAHYLKKLGLSTEDRVGLFMERSTSAIIAILGIMKAGGAYLPIDTSNPTRYVDDIFRDAQVKIILTDKIHVQGFKNLNLNLEWEKIRQQPSDNLGIAIQGNNLAYVLYTSGSTGNPKGVCIEHCQLSSYIHAIWKNMSLEETSKFAVLSSLSTDMGNTMIFPPLSYGATLVIIPNELVYNPSTLSRMLSSSPVDCLKLTPTHMRIFMDAKIMHNILPKKLLILAGEALQWELIEYIKKYGDCRIANYYGPTETTITTLTYYHNSQVIEQTSSVPLGYPISNTQVYIFNKNLIQVPQGAVGELYIGGSGLARSYINDPKLTNIKFPVINGVKLYKTGDMVRIRYDKAIEFISRQDRQIKIFGYRVDLDGIETTIMSYPGVKRAAVINVNRGIIAYITLRNKKSISINKVKESLANKLPKHMLPYKIVILDKLPMSIGGKVDYKQLPQVIHDFLEEQKTKILPRDLVELKLVQIWEEILEVKNISINEEFFELGGYSIQAMKIMWRIEEQFNKKLSLSTFFKYNTIEKMAKIIRRNYSSVKSTSLLELTQHSDLPKFQLFFIHPAGGNIFCYYELARFLSNEYQFYGIQSQAFYDETTIDDNVSNHIYNMAQYYLQEVIKVIKRGTIVVFGGWSMGGVVAFEMACQFSKIVKDKNLPLIVLLDQQVPQVQDITDDEVEYIISFVKKIELLTGIESNLSSSEFLNKAKEEKTKIVLDYFKKAKIVPNDLKTNDFEKFLEIQKLHSHVINTYRPSIYEGNALIIRAEDRIFDNNKNDDMSLGWNKYFKTLPQIESVPGNHITMMGSNNIRFTVQKLKKWLEIMQYSNNYTSHV